MALLWRFFDGPQVEDLRSNPALLDLQKHGDVPRAQGIDDDMSNEQNRRTTPDGHGQRRNGGEGKAGQEFATPGQDTHAGERSVLDRVTVHRCQPGSDAVELLR
jgi:hypothetical protein